TLICGVCRTMEGGDPAPLVQPRSKQNPFVPRSGNRARGNHVLTTGSLPPMKTKVVTFDCANTLVRVDWSPGGFALDCARASGLEVADEDRVPYEQALRSRWSEYREINETRDDALADAFWRKLTEDWLTGLGHSADLAERLVGVAPELLYGRESERFVLFEDVLPTLEALTRHGIRVGVISNWDYSLHRVLRALDVHHRFEHVVASLQEGVEKPDPRLFHLTLEKFGVGPGEAVHVGDDPLDDLRGAQDVGMRAYLIDRRRPDSQAPFLARLTDLVEALGLISR
ncbi:MAG TPA: HAD-IA family hydrolase, partial [Fimbriimonadaceae bacterium]|nr:HAD-IA family hydrolase [Fimbriimonadaceae bacterium]